MDLIMTKWAGMEAAAILACDRREELLGRFPEALVRSAAELGKENDITEAVRAVKHFGPCFLRPLGEGGIFTALWMLAEEAKAGLEVDLRKIPVKQEAIEICEYFDINPYNACSGGCLLAAVQEGSVLAERLARDGIPAAVIGRLTDGNDRIIWNDGNKRFLDRPQREELYKIYETLPEHK